MPHICLEYEFDRWWILTYCTFRAPTKGFYKELLVCQQKNGHFWAKDDEKCRFSVVVTEVVHKGFTQMHLSFILSW